MHSTATSPGTSTPCCCFTFLELLADYPDGPFTETFAHFASAGGCGIRKGHMVKQWDWCPSCGGKLGKYRPELSAAYAAYRAAIAGPYAPLLARTDDVARFRIACEYLGAKLVSPASNDAIGYAYHDAGSSLSISIVWDNDHDTWYPHVEFAPDDTLRRDPFVPEIKL